MRKVNLFAIVLVTAILLSVSALSQITNIASRISQITPTISLEEKQTCTTEFYDEVQHVYGTCTNTINQTICLNITGPNTDCSFNQIQRNFTCKTGELIVKRNSTDCIPLNKFIVLTDNGVITNKKEVDFSSWGVCVNSTENNCLAITCGTLKGGSARNGIFNGCDGGKSCQKFLFCEDGVKILYKASRNDFVKEDPTYRLSKLAYKEVGK